MFAAKKDGDDEVNYACKLVKRNGRMNDAASMQTEVTIMKKLDHPNVVKLQELFETEDKTWMVMELANGGELMKALGELDVFSEQRVAALFKHILLGVKYLHSKGVVHRDLKMDNLLYSKDEEGNVTPKITDFGLSAITIKREESSAKQSKQLHTLKDMWGTAEYFAPEVYRRAYGFQADIWALGCLLFEMLTGEIAFPYRERMVSFADRVFFYGLKKPVRPFELKAGWKTLSPSVQSLIKGMLKTDPTKRFDIDECLRHPWITGPHPAAQCVELKESRKIIRERLDRKAKRYEAAVREMEREKVHASIIAKQ